MEGFCAKRTKNHLIEPIGYGLIRKTVKRGAHVNGAVDQYRIHEIAADFRSEWIQVPAVGSQDSLRSYTMTECVDCDRLPSTMIPELYACIEELDADYVKFKCYMMREGYFVRGSSFLRKQTTFTRPPIFVVDFSLYGAIQEGLVRFPDLPWTYTIFQAELLFGF